MGNIAPVALQAVQAFQTISSAAQVFNDSGNNLSLQQLQQQQALQQRQDLQDAQIKREEIAAKAQESERLRKSALKRAVAKRRAEFGAGGVGSSNGSSEAVLLGLFEESEEEKQNREKLDNLRLKSLEQGISQRSAVNTLLKTQLKQKQDLQRTSDLLSSTDDLLQIF